eukprot:scaffold482_cov266-Amphora_coffeaeformis.AAC.12
MVQYLVGRLLDSIFDDLETGQGTTMLRQILKGNFGQVMLVYECQFGYRRLAVQDLGIQLQTLIIALDKVRNVIIAVEHLRYRYSRRHLRRRWHDGKMACRIY